MDLGKVSFTVAVTLSYLTTKQQAEIADYLETTNVKMAQRQADELKMLSEREKLTSEEIKKIMVGERTKRVKEFKINKKILKRYFDKTESEDKMQEIVEEALKLYFNRQ